MNGLSRKFLNELGLEKDQINAIMDKQGELIESHKDALKEKESEINQLKNDIKKRENEIESLNNSEIKKEDYDELQKKYEELEKKSNDDIANVKKSFLIDKELTNSKAKNVEVLRKQLDFDKITLEEDKITGLSEQIKALQKSDAYLFDLKTENSTIELNGNLNGNAPQNEPKDLRSALHEKYDK